MDSLPPPNFASPSFLEKGESSGTLGEYICILHLVRMSVTLSFVTSGLVLKTSFSASNKLYLSHSGLGPISSFQILSLGLSPKEGVGDEHC